MAKRMGYSVVGLPHYTIWHLYEPSLDDIRHMEVSSALPTDLLTSIANAMLMFFAGNGE